MVFLLFSLLSLSSSLRTAYDYTYFDALPWTKYLMFKHGYYVKLCLNNKLSIPTDYLFQSLGPAQSVVHEVALCSRLGYLLIHLQDGWSRFTSFCFITDFFTPQRNRGGLYFYFSLSVCLSVCVLHCSDSTYEAMTDFMHMPSTWYPVTLTQVKVWSKGQRRGGVCVLWMLVVVVVVVVVVFFFFFF